MMSTTAIQLTTNDIKILKSTDIKQKIIIQMKDIKEAMILRTMDIRRMTRNPDRGHFWTMVKALKMKIMIVTINTTTKTRSKMALTTVIMITIWIQTIISEVYEDKNDV